MNEIRNSILYIIANEVAVLSYISIIIISSFKMYFKEIYYFLKEVAMKYDNIQTVYDITNELW